jgi:hypothetical protein
LSLLQSRLLMCYSHSWYHKGLLCSFSPNRRQEIQHKSASFPK